jgi:hypothetical protein
MGRSDILRMRARSRQGDGSSPAPTPLATAQQNVADVTAQINVETNLCRARALSTGNQP